MSRLNVAVYTLGCKSNQADSAALLGGLDTSAVQIVDAFDRADVVVINTCCVTAEAERDCRKAVRRAQRLNSNVHVVLTGCAISAFADFAVEFKEGLVTAFGGGKTHLRQLADWLNAMALETTHEEPKGRHPGETYRFFDDAIGVAARGNVAGRSRGLLKVQNGCTHNCSYCIVPRARGAEQSMPLLQAVNEAGRMKRLGFLELVITGVQIGAWGKDLLGTPTLATLLNAVADAFSPGRIRLGSIEPWAVTDALVHTVAGHPRICPHLHIPLQSGDDGVLRDMNRGYTSLDYMGIVERARAVIPGLALGVDVIAGFPSETEAAFENTLRVIAKLAPAHLHGFPYSPRRYTAAYTMKSIASRKAAKERAAQVMALGKEWAKAYVASRVDGLCEVLVEEEERGMTEDYLGVRILGGIRGTLIRARLQTTDGADEWLRAVPLK